MLEHMLGLLRAGQLAILRGRAERVLWRMAELMPEGTGQVSVGVLATLTGMERRSVVRALHDLEAVGWVRRRGRGLDDVLLWSLCLPLPNCHPPLSRPEKSPHSQGYGTEAHSSPASDPRPGPRRRGGRKPAGGVRL